jgi:hypothetical protein
LRGLRTSLTGMTKLRIYADFNSCMEDDRGHWCWCLRYGGKTLDEVAASLQIYEGMPVTLYYEDPVEEFEMDAKLGHGKEPGGEGRWMALFDQGTMRRLRG